MILFHAIRKYSESSENKAQFAPKEDIKIDIIVKKRCDC